MRYLSLQVRNLCMPLYSGGCHLGTQVLDLLLCCAQRIFKHFQLPLLLCYDVLFLLLNCICCIGCNSWLLLDRRFRWLWLWLISCCWLEL